MLKPGDQLPDAVFKWIPPQAMNACATRCMGKPEDLSTENWKSLKVVLFSLPGAFTPVCSATHLPDYLASYDQLKSKGVDIVAVLAINDPYVMKAWGDSYCATDKIMFLTDVEAAFSRSFDGHLDLTAYGMGTRTNRYALIIDHGKVIYAGLEPDPGKVTVSGVEAVLKALEGSV